MQQLPLTSHSVSLSQVCLGPGWQHELEQPDRLGDKFKLHINLPGAAQEIVAGCSAVGRFLKLNVVSNRSTNLLFADLLHQQAYTEPDCCQSSALSLASVSQLSSVAPSSKGCAAAMT